MTAQTHDIRDGRHLAAVPGPPTVDAEVRPEVRDDVWDEPQDDAPPRYVAAGILDEAYPEPQDDVPPGYAAGGAVEVRPDTVPAGRSGDATGQWHEPAAAGSPSFDAVRVDSCWATSAIGTGSAPSTSSRSSSRSRSVGFVTPVTEADGRSYGPNSLAVI